MEIAGKNLTSLSFYYQISGDFIIIFPDHIIFTLPQTALEDAQALFENNRSVTCIENCAKLQLLEQYHRCTRIVSKIVTNFSPNNRVPIYQSADSYYDCMDSSSGSQLKDWLLIHCMLFFLTKWESTRKHWVWLLFHGFNV